MEVLPLILGSAGDTLRRTVYGSSKSHTEAGSCETSVMCGVHL